MSSSLGRWVGWPTSVGVGAHQRASDEAPPPPRRKQERRNEEGLAATSQRLVEKLSGLMLHAAAFVCLSVCLPVVALPHPPADTRAARVFITM